MSDIPLCAHNISLMEHCESCRLAVARDGIITVTLRDGSNVLGKLYKGEASARTYSNWTQALTVARRIGGKVMQRGRPFYVVVPRD